MDNSDQVVWDEHIPQNRLAVPINSTMTGPGLTMEELKAYVKTGRGYETLVHDNLTVSQFLLTSRWAATVKIPPTKADR